MNDNEITREQLAVLFPAIVLTTTIAVGLGLRKLEKEYDKRRKN